MMRLLALAILLAMPASLPAQIRASERGSVSQTVDGTVITLEYGRPRVRDRSPIFGGIVHWGEVWTPGANFATTLETSKAIKLEGHEVPAGKYSVWLVVVDSTSWTLVLDPQFHRFHMNPPDSSAAGAIRFPVERRAGGFTEVLTWSFPAIRTDGTTLLFQWADVSVSLGVTVSPSHPLTIARNVVAPVLGRYAFRWAEQPAAAPPSYMTMTHVNDMLMMTWEPAPFPDVASMVLIRIADDWFNPGILQDGKLYDVYTEWVFEFKRSGGTVTGFELRGDRDVLEGSGTRVP